MKMTDLSILCVEVGKLEKLDSVSNTYLPHCNIQYIIHSIIKKNIMIK